MFSTFIGEAKDYFGKGFILAVWMPVFMASMIITLTFLAVQNSLSWSSWTALGDDQKIVLSFSSLIAVTTTAFLLHHLQTPITRLFEGYWEGYPFLKRLYRYKKNLYFCRFRELYESIKKVESKTSKSSFKIAQHIDILLRQYPPANIETLENYDPAFYVMPTRLGNIYRSAELYSLSRYGLESTLFWPHLIAVIPGSFAQRLEDKKIAVDFWLLVSLLFLLYAVVFTFILIFSQAPLILIILLPTILLLSYLCYCAALIPAKAYGVLIRSAFDLYRRLLLQKLGYQIPETLVEEKKIWCSLQFFMYNGAPLDSKIKLAQSGF